MRHLRTLPCRLGWHKPIASGVWNAGYCFTSCDRCGRDMVKSVFGEWHVPANFRVVWNAPETVPVAPPPPHVEAERIVAEPIVAQTEAPTAPPAPLPAEPAKARSPFDFDDFD